MEQTYYLLPPEGESDAYIITDTRRMLDRMEDLELKMFFTVHYQYLILLHTLEMMVQSGVVKKIGMEEEIDYRPTVNLFAREMIERKGLAFTVESLKEAMSTYDVA